MDGGPFNEIQMTSLDRSPFVLRWLGITLLILTIFQVATSFLNDSFTEHSGQEILLQFQFAFVGLILMIFSLRKENSVIKQLFTKRFIAISSFSFSIVLMVLVWISMQENRKLSSEVNVSLNQLRSQLKLTREYAESPHSLKDLANQLVIAGELSPNATAFDKTSASLNFINHQERQLNQQITQYEQQRNIEANLRRVRGPASLLVLSVAFLLLAFTSLR